MKLFSTFNFDIPKILKIIKKIEMINTKFVFSIESFESGLVKKDKDFLNEINKTVSLIVKSLKKGNKILLQCGGGGGYGDPKERDHNKIIDDVKQGYLSKEYVNKYYPDVKL